MAQPCQPQGPLPRAGGTRGSTVTAHESEPKPPPANRGHGSCSQQNQFKHEQPIGKEFSFITGTREKFPPASPDCALFSLAQTHPALPNGISARTSNSRLAIPGETFRKEDGCHSHTERKFQTLHSTSTPPRDSNAELSNVGALQR